jgi:hypothetical protein
VAMVGLPARGKSYMSEAILRYSAHCTGWEVYVACRITGVLRTLRVQRATCDMQRATTACTADCT